MRPLDPIAHIDLHVGFEGGTKGANLARSRQYAEGECLGWPGYTSEFLQCEYGSEHSYRVSLGNVHSRGNWGRLVLLIEDEELDEENPEKLVSSHQNLNHVSLQH